MLFTPFELLDMVVMTLIIGFLFQDAFHIPERTRARYALPAYGRKNTRAFWYACALIAPAIILHELAHKFVALSAGLTATFHAACSTADIATGSFLTTFCGLQVIAIIMKALGSGFFLFVPGFVSTSGSASHLTQALVSFAGPAMHLAIWGACAIILKARKRLTLTTRAFLIFSRQVNLFLLVFNMLPIPGFDGFSVAYHLIAPLF